MNKRGRSSMRLARCSGRCESSRYAKPEYFRRREIICDLIPIYCLLRLYIICSARSVPMTLWTGIRSAIRVDYHQAVRIWRCQSTLTTSSPSISPTLLGRARALAAEHADLSRRLNSGYDTKLAKKAGTLSAVAEALNGWESANNVRLAYDT